MRPWRRVFTAAVKMPSWFIAAFAAESSPAVVYESMRIVTVGILFSVKGKIVFSSVTARENSNNTSRKFIRDINAELEYCGMIFFPLFLVVVAVLKGDLKFLAVQKPYKLLQFLVSKSVACCVPFETYGKHSGAQSAEVVSLLHHLIVDSDPSLYDFIRFVKRSCNMPPRYCLHGVKKQNILHSNSKPIAIAHQGVSSSGISEISGVHRNLFDKGGPADASVEARGHAAKGDAGEGIKPSASAIPLACGDFFSGDQEKFLALGSSLASKGTNTLLSNPLREVLSPIDANVSRRKVVYFESVNPQTPDASTCERNKTKCIGTPLDKFNARSSNLKNTLAQEYVDFLNAASLEELLEIKGIGSKTAECIIELREKTPLKSLSDLEKLGLSSKQVHNLFSTAAKGIFT